LFSLFFFLSFFLKKQQLFSFSSYFSLRFRVGPQEVHNFRMIERHYHNGTGELMKSYDFNFSFCIPNSTNEWEAIYDMPPLHEREVQSLIENGSCSDSFYFVNNKLIMHNKARYNYVENYGYGQTGANQGAGGSSSHQQEKKRGH
jgi:hypothetical protein